MWFNIITIFPDIFASYFSESILGRAQKHKIIKIKAHDLRKWATDKHRKVDDSPYGGGPGMIFKVEPIYKAVEALEKIFPLNLPLLKGEKKRGLKKTLRQAQGINSPHPDPPLRRGGKTRVILFSAKGKVFTQADARRLAKYDQLILICGRYEGVDERVAGYIADEELSVGNFVLTGGEIPAMIVVDAVSRLLPGVLGKKESLEEESFGIAKREARSADQNAIGDRRQATSYLEYPQYTRPEEFRGWKAPEVLLSGNHKKIEEWRRKNQNCET